MHFEFATATKIVFGPGTLKNIGLLARAFGDSALVVTGRDRTRAQSLLGNLAQAGIRTHLFATSGEPDLNTVTTGVTQARKSGCNLVIGFGGGSALDAAKAVAAMLANPGELLDYLEVIGRGKPLIQNSLPFIAVPTTAGTGSEVTRNAVLASPAHRVKVSLRSPLMLPRLALVDPELTYGLPPEVTGTTGLDALTQLIEPYVCSRPNPMVDGFCVEGIRRAAKALPLVFADGQNSAARVDMAVASLLGGLALANAGLGAVHGFAGPIGGMFPAPHGAVCAALLPVVTEANIRALRDRQPQSETLTRYDCIARLLTDNPGATALDAVGWLKALVRTLKVPGLGVYGLTRKDLPDVVKKAAVASSMKANPIVLTPEQLADILERAL